MEDATQASLIKRLTPAVWAKWDAKLYNWALVYGATEERTEPVSSAYRALEDGEHRGEIIDPKARAATWEAEEPPGISIEAIDTHSLVVLLPTKPANIYRAVHAFWAGSGPLWLRADSIGVHENTLRNQAKEAVVRLEIMDGARRRGEKPVVMRTQFVPEDEYR